jgi:hypothetical protein
MNFSATSPAVPGRSNLATTPMIGRASDESFEVEYQRTLRDRSGGFAAFKAALPPSLAAQNQRRWGDDHQVRMRDTGARFFGGALIGRSELFFFFFV